jgi:hypothetical protein
MGRVQLPKGSLIYDWLMVCKGYEEGISKEEFERIATVNGLLRTFNADYALNRLRDLGYLMVNDKGLYITV